jgi:rRNA maturation RNase YbeY
MIHIKNSQRKIAINIPEMTADLQSLLNALKYPDFDISVLITTNTTIRAYNRDYRDKDKATDILSFPYHPELIAGKRIKVKEPEDKNLGDLIISAEYVTKDAQELKVTFEQRMKRLLVHGVCHLLNYDHIDDADWRRMRAKEGFLLKKINYQSKL